MQTIFKHTYMRGYLKKIDRRWHVVFNGREVPLLYSDAVCVELLHKVSSRQDYKVVDFEARDYLCEEEEHMYVRIYANLK